MVTELVEVAHQVLAAAVELIADQVAPALEAERLQTLLVGYVETDVLRAKLLIHPADAGLGHGRHRAALDPVVSEAQGGRPGARGIQDKSADPIVDRKC